MHLRDDLNIYLQSVVTVVCCQVEVSAKSWNIRPEEYLLSYL